MSRGKRGSGTVNARRSRIKAMNTVRTIAFDPWGSTMVLRRFAERGG